MKKGKRKNSEEKPRSADEERLLGWSKEQLVATVVAQRAQIAKLMDRLLQLGGQKEDEKTC